MDYSVNKNLIFKSKEHEEFFYRCLAKSDRHDEDYQALFYCLGIDRDTRDHIEEIYNFESRTINPDCINAWGVLGIKRISWSESIEIQGHISCCGSDLQKL